MQELKTSLFEAEKRGSSLRNLRRKICTNTSPCREMDSEKNKRLQEKSNGSRFPDDRHAEHGALAVCGRPGQQAEHVGEVDPATPASFAPSSNPKVLAALPISPAASHPILPAASLLSPQWSHAEIFRHRESQRWRQEPGRCGTSYGKPAPGWQPPPGESWRTGTRC